jgi:hypothetical protein
VLNALNYRVRYLLWLLRMVHWAFTGPRSAWTLYYGPTGQGLDKASRDILSERWDDTAPRRPSRNHSQNG